MRNLGFIMFALSLLLGWSGVARADVFYDYGSGHWIYVDMSGDRPDMGTRPDDGGGDDPGGDDDDDDDDDDGSGNSGGSKPGHGHGDKNHDHNGPPGLS